MSNSNRLLAVCVCVFMLVSMLVFPASAVSDTDTATLGSCSIVANLYLDQRTLSAYTRLGAGADYASITVSFWQKNATTGAVEPKKVQTTDKLNPTYITFSRSADTGYVFHRTNSSHYVRVGSQYLFCDLGDIYA